ncbi:sensor histidine kinase [Thalassovita mediterranea]|jgi:signal transduction histidine kinase|uniref:histidine kinase n=1 Tax=Thalassovita mediterranea TaxID=340021 RepID=A0A0P1GN45_9RHOB|nr:ATP-binding protein [Thalassovita mediterranea]CUH83600.1 Non-motile and phage-resistance protein [Thalassovita mediterranea]SIS34395.1 Signal transduction histidine kinase [Thalassovita mediterranea]
MSVLSLTSFSAWGRPMRAALQRMPFQGLSLGRYSPLRFMRNHTHLLIYIYLIASMAVIETVLERYTIGRAQALQTEDVSEQTNTLRARLQGEVLARALQMRGMAAAITVMPDMPADQFDAIAEQVTADAPVIRMVAAAPDLVIRHVHPATDNAALLGLDYRQYDQVMAVIETARTTGNTVLDGPLNIGGGKQGLVLRTPIFLPGDASDEAPARPFWGMMSATLDLGVFLEQSGIVQGARHLDIALRRPATAEQPPRMIFGAAELFEQGTIRQRIDLPQGNWELAARPKGGWDQFAEERRQLRFWVLLATVLALLVAAYLIEISRRKTAAEKNLINAINAISDGFALFDANDRLVMSNAQFRRSLGGVGQAALRPGMLFEDLLREGAARGLYPEAEGCEDDWVADRMLAHQAADFEQDELLSDGTWLRASERRTEDGWTVAFRMDITALKEAQLAAEAASLAKTEFLNIVTHELRTPLTVVLGYNAFLKDPATLPASQALSDQQGGISAAHQELLNTVARYAAKMDASGQHLLNLIQETLDYAKIEEGKMQIHPTDVPVRNLIEDVIDQFQQQADAKGLDLWAEADDVTVQADETRLKQILFNLVGNAMKFTNAGEVAIRTEVEGNTLRFSVMDTGQGIPKAEQSKVFDSFHQVEAADLRRQGGTGLGLSISRNLVELHGGRMSLQSREGHGSCFQFTIPLATTS